jgi:ADP-ribose pyrophosphatase YjhB (NUDIX family)
MGDKPRPVSIVFLLKEDSILLAMKKRGFGQGHWNGAGGKPEAGEDIIDTARRECFEEIGVKPGQLDKVAVINFYSQGKPGDNQQAHVYFCKDWGGEPRETEEMRPQWFKLDAIPYEMMWADDKDWLPLVLGGKKIEADFYFGDNNQVIKRKIKSLKLA